MSADGHLLTLAAKAAGVCLHADVTYSYGNWGCDTTCKACKKDPSDARWDPLNVDSDALQLAAMLKIDLCFDNAGIEAVWINEEISETHSLREHADLAFEGIDKRMKATRRAIVRAAAEIGGQS